MAKHILVTNDDGVFAPGLLALVEEMRKLGRVTSLAPDRNWSGGGHVKTLDRALRVKEVRLADGTQGFAGDGAPSDCVALATLGYFKEPIDLVVSLTSHQLDLTAYRALTDLNTWHWDEPSFEIALLEASQTVSLPQ
jgi:5'/3'-nucleotidase SurE